MQGALKSRPHTLIPHMHFTINLCKLGRKFMFTPSISKACWEKIPWSKWGRCFKSLYASCKALSPWTKAKATELTNPSSSTRMNTNIHKQTNAFSFIFVVHSSSGQLFSAGEGRVRPEGCNQPTHFHFSKKPNTHLWTVQLLKWCFYKWMWTSDVMEHILHWLCYRYKRNL